MSMERTSVKESIAGMAALRQQKLKAWKPSLTPKRATIVFSVFALIFIVIGIPLLIVSNRVMEYEHDYTECIGQGTDVKCHAAVTPSCKCTHKFNITENIPAPVYLYYGLENFYQNHRRYARSRNDNQLRGKVQKPADLSSCAPVATDTSKTPPQAYLPCGAIANSIFNDTFSIQYKTNNVPTTKQGIAWRSDVHRLYANLSAEALENTVKPPNWKAPLDKPFAGAEDLMVWMRISALPNFYKLYAFFEHSGDFAHGLPKGEYVVEINYNFPVVGFNGHKKILISNASFLGGKNSFLGIAFLVTGCIYLLMAVGFFALSRKQRSIGLHSMTHQQ